MVRIFLSDIKVMNAELGLTNPESQIICNPFAISCQNFMNTDNSLEGQLKKFLTMGFGYWSSIFADRFTGQTQESFQPTTKLMLEFWSNPSVVGNFPNLAIIAKKVSFFVLKKCANFRSVAKQTNIYRQLRADFFAGS